MKECHRRDTEEYVLFYENDFFFLSNLSAFALYWKDYRFDTAEAAYHWEKFNIPLTLSDKGIALRRLTLSIRTSILKSISAHEAFKIAEANKELVRPNWDAMKVDVMRDILRAKANQHEYVQRKLLATEDRELIEDSWRDDFWGWGPEQNGQNMMGKLWMEIRDELRQGKPV